MFSQRDLGPRGARGCVDPACDSLGSRAVCAPGQAGGEEEAVGVGAARRWCPGSKNCHLVSVAHSPGVLLWKNTPGVTSTTVTTWERAIEGLSVPPMAPSASRMLLVPVQRCCPAPHRGPRAHSASLLHEAGSSGHWEWDRAAGVPLCRARGTELVPPGSSTQSWRADGLRPFRG